SPSPQSKKFYGTRLRSHHVQVGEAFEVSGDKEHRAQVERSLELMVQQKLQEADAQAQALLAKASAQAEALTTQARQQADAMIAEAQSQRDTIRGEAYQEGCEAGFAQGYQDATDQVAQETMSLLSGAHAVAEQAYQLEARVLKNFQPNALQLVRVTC